MSVTNDGQYVICDGAGCRAEARLPVALRPLLSRPPSSGEARIDGWLFVDGRTGRRHFCPRCAQQYLGGLAQSSGKSDRIQEERG
ncbi:MAG: hypothetical protein M3Y28_08210 [Armatimonadota bacterium]|nr:hypothetical protein [Armatimonadota bacterium]